MVELDETLFGTLICAMEQGHCFHLHQLLVAICNLQNHCHYSDVTHHNLEASVELGKLMRVNEGVD